MTKQSRSSSRNRGLGRSNATPLDQSLLPDSMTGPPLTSNQDDKTPRSNNKFSELEDASTQSDMDASTKTDISFNRMHVSTSESFSRMQEQLTHNQDDLKHTIEKSNIGLQGSIDNGFETLDRTFDQGFDGLSQKFDLLINIMSEIVPHREENNVPMTQLRNDKNPKATSRKSEKPCTGPP